MVTNPKVLLLDEPLSALDKALRIDMQVELKRIQREIGITTIFVTHDQEEALTLSDKIGILRDGRMVQAGPPRDVYNNPYDIFTAEFLGEANILSGKGDAPSALQSPGADIRLPSNAGTNPVLAVRPENMTITSAEPDEDGLSKMPAALVRRIFSGAMATCVLESNGTVFKVIARDQDIPDLPEGGQVWLSWDANKTITIPSNVS
jgi:ABC-type Fe3+/spermidine/putrescine transport system ATPase subunit